MTRLQRFSSALIGGASVIALSHPAIAKVYDIPGGDLVVALDAYSAQSGVQIIYSDEAVRGHRTKGAKGDYSELAALTQVLSGTGFTARTMSSNEIGIVPQPREDAHVPVKVAQAARRAPAAPAPVVPAAVETVVVTAQKKSENIQNVPIAVTALSQAQLTERQIAGGPDLVKEVPNLTFSKTNFTGYNIQIRGIGTQAISVTTDPAVAVAFNGIPFIRNHFFEQEFYDVQDVEVLRGPQGTLYGRNATAGVVNVKSALPTDQFEAMLSADFGNYSNRRYEGMINLPVVGDKLDLRVAGEWTKRDGYSFNVLTNSPIDGRDLWSSRATLAWKPSNDIQAYLVWEHFQEDDDRMRTAKQLCKTAPTPTEVDGVPVPVVHTNNAYEVTNYLSQGCLPTSLYSPDAFEVPNGFSLPYYNSLSDKGAPLTANDGVPFDPYASTTQSRNLRDIESTINPIYRAKNDTLELNADYNVTPALTFSSQTGYNRDFLWSTEDYNRFNTAPGAFDYDSPDNVIGKLQPDPSGLGICANNGTGECSTLPPGAYCTDPGTYSCHRAGVFCDPQVGCSDRLVAQDLSDEHSWQLSQEFRLASHFGGPFNFSIGGNYLHYVTEENYYVFINTVTLASYGWTLSTTGTRPQTLPWMPGVSDNSNCVRGGFQYVDLSNPGSTDVGSGEPATCMYIDPNPITSLNNQGHNYFLSQNPYMLNSYAGFGEAYYDVASDLKLTGGLRWTEDRKHFVDIPSELLVHGYGYPTTRTVDQQWDQLTGRAAVDWTPKLDFTDQTLLYGSYSHGYKAGGANPPGATLLVFGNNDIANPIHPLTFKPEFVDAFELGSKNTLLDGALTLNGDIFYYVYKNYQISRIVDRTAINDNFNTHVRGAELESSWEPAPGLKLSFAGGYENATLDRGDNSVDLMDRTAGHPGWMVVKPFVTQASNCILPDYLIAASFGPYAANDGLTVDGGGIEGACAKAYVQHVDPLTGLPYKENPTAIAPNYNPFVFPIPGYPGFDPLSVDPTAPADVNNGLGLPPNNGEGFSKDLGGKQLPNAPHFTTSLSVDYTLPVSDDWAATLHTDFYWQSQSWARVFNDRPYDKIHGYSNVNLALILSSADGWQVMAYVKNLFDTTAITGDFLNSDDSGLTTNVFLTDPRLFGVRVTKNFGEGDSGAVADAENWIADLFADKDNGRPPLWIELGGQLSRLDDAQQPFAPAFLASRPSIFEPSQKFEHSPLYSFDETGKVSFQPDGSDWVLAASIRYGRSASHRYDHQQTKASPVVIYYYRSSATIRRAMYPSAEKFAETNSRRSEQHLVMDFQAGKDVGLGIFGADSSSTVDLGVRFAQFSAKTNVVLRSNPDAHPTIKYFTSFRTAHGGPLRFIAGGSYHSNSASFVAKRSFHGIGPSISWNGSVAAAGSPAEGELDFDWGLNAALLFGKQRVSGHHQTTSEYHHGKYSYTNFRHVVYQTNSPIARTRTVVVPNIGGLAGISWRYQNAKVSFGYRADEFFGAIDGGIDSRKSENMGFFGPYASVSLGLGG